MKIHVFNFFITATLLSSTNLAISSAVDGRTELTSEQLRCLVLTGAECAQFNLGNILTPLVGGLFILSVFFIVKYIIYLPRKNKAKNLLENYKNELNSLNSESDFFNRRRQYYIWRIDKFLENGQWVSMKTGLHEKISPSLVNDFINYHNNKMKRVDLDESLYHSALKKIKTKDFIKFRELSEEMNKNILNNDYDLYKNNFHELVSYGKNFCNTKLDGIEIDANIDDLSERFFYTKEINKIIKDSTSFYVAGMMDIYSKKLFNSIIIKAKNTSKVKAT
jgi:hypothetical protein